MICYPHISVSCLVRFADGFYFLVFWHRIQSRLSNIFLLISYFSKNKIETCMKEDAQDFHLPNDIKMQLLKGSHQKNDPCSYLTEWINWYEFSKYFSTTIFLFSIFLQLLCDYRFKISDLSMMRERRALFVRFVHIYNRACSTSTLLLPLVRSIRFFEKNFWNLLENF